MIKGVNRQVLEIHDTGNQYFEKALLFVKPEYSTLSETRLRDAAQKAFGSCDKIPKCRGKKALGLILKVLSLIASAGTGALITFFAVNQ